jgi:hypothetical protein
MAVHPKLPGGDSQKYKGEVQATTKGQPFAKPREAHTDDIGNMQSLHNDIGEKSGFQTEGYLVKKGTEYGEAAKFNFLPPGMDISNQVCKDIREMPFKEITDMSYPGDGWEPAPRDIKEGVSPANE